MGPTEEKPVKPATITEFVAPKKPRDPRLPWKKNGGKKKVA